MQIKIFHLPLAATEEEEEEVNRFLRSHRIVEMRKELAQSGGESSWTVFLTYLEQTGAAVPDTARPKGKVDYMKVLDPPVFERFAALRKIRKQLADKEAVPAYVIFTDSELAEMAKMTEITPQAIAELPGVGKVKVEKYGSFFTGTEKVTGTEGAAKVDGDEKTEPF